LAYTNIVRKKERSATTMSTEKLHYALLL